MSSGIYSALSGSLARMQNLEVAVNNLANVGNVGFKASRLSFESMFKAGLQNAGAQGMNFTRTASRYVDFSQGALVKTDRPLDLAIEGKGFFKVAGTDGFKYTRQGNFKLDAQGNLVTAAGDLQVVGEEGPINFPHENVTIDRQGRVVADGGQIGQITLYEVSDQQGMVALGDGLWELPPGETDAPATGTKVVQGNLEQSNANPLLLTVEIVEIKRAYAVYMQTMKAFGEMSEKSAEIGRIG